MNFKIKNEFPFFNNNQETTYLDSAATTLKLKRVNDKLYDYYNNNGANVSRGAYKESMEATNLFENTRKLVANFINADESEVIFTKGATDSLNSLAISLEGFINENDIIITSELEHHSSYLPWFKISESKSAKLEFVPLSLNGRITLDNFKKVMTKDVKVIALTHASNVLGYETPVNEIVKYARTINQDVIVILDAAQSVSHKKIDVKDLDIDFLAFSAHKMYGPNGVGVLYGKAALLEKLPPFAYGGEMADLVYKDNVTYKDIPNKFEAGTPVVAEVIAFSEAINFINEIGIDNIYSHEKAIRNYLVSELKKIEGVIIYNEVSESPLVTFNVKNIHPHDLVQVFNTENVAVRAGHHCAQLVSRFLKVNSTLRASIAIYTTKEDIDKFIIVVKKAINYFEGFGF